MIISIFFFIVAYLVGRAIIKLTKLKLEHIIHPGSMVVGLTVICLLFYLEGLIFGSLKFLRELMTLGGLIVIAGVVLRREIKLILTGRFFRRPRLSSGLLRMTTSGLFLIFIIWFFGRSLFFGPQGEIIAGDRLVWTDWPLHIGMAANFAYGANFPAQNPHFAGIALTYPFMSDFLSGILLSLGVSLPLSFVIPGIVLTLCFAWIFVEWGKSFWRPKAEESKNITRRFFANAQNDKANNQDDKKQWIYPYLALLISLFWGGLGWWFWVKDVFASEITLIENLFFPPREYTFWAEKGLWFFTFLYSEILPQRAFLFGLPLFFLILYLVKLGWDTKENKYFFTAGILGGILPFFHTHTFISLWMLSGSVGIIGIILSFIPAQAGILKKDPRVTCPPDAVASGNCRREPEDDKIFTKNLIGRSFANAQDDKINTKELIKNFISYFAPFILLSLIQLPLFNSKSLLNLPFVFGWMKGKENFFIFWFKNTGLFIPLWILGFWKGNFSRFVKILGISSWSLFILPNLFQFAPWGYDNLKIITFWYVIGSVFVVGGIKYMSQTCLVGRQVGQIRLIGKIVAVLIFISLTLSGFLEIGRLTHVKKTQITLWSKKDQELAEIIRQKTPPKSIFLAAAVHDHPIEALAGRKIILGFPGNSWSWGIEGWDIRERDIHTMLQGGDQALALWKKYGINYIMISDRERWFEPKLDEKFVAENSELFLEKNNTKIYKVN